MDSSRDGGMRCNRLLRLCNFMFLVCAFMMDAN
jgi:hypothetical protein